VKVTLFSVEQANQLLPDLRPVVEEVMRAKQELTRLDRRIDVLTLAAAGTSPENPDARELALSVERRSRLVDRIRRGVRSIQDKGPVVKDLDKGLLDFYSLAGDRLIFLCWHLGEPEVGHWHPLEGGFATRQPLHRTERE
jgi:hypothetical protein